MFFDSINAKNVNDEDIPHWTHFVKSHIAYICAQSTHIYMCRASIPSLFLRFVLILKVYILEKIIVLIFKKCPYFWLASLFCLIFNKAAILRKPFSSWPQFFSVKVLWHHKSNTILFGTQRSKAADRHEALFELQAVLVRSEG